MKSLKQYEFSEFYDLWDADKIDPTNHYKEIEALTFNDLENAIKCVARYGVEISERLLKNILHKRIDLAYEVINKGITDTCQREKLYDAICLEVDLPSPPCYGSTQEYKDNFYNLARNVNPILGVKFNV